MTFDMNNRVVGKSYDSGGNMTNDSNHTYVFDGENRISGYDANTNQYAYDGEGSRVKKVNANSVMIYDMHGRMIAEYTIDKCIPGHICRQSDASPLTKEYV